MFLQVGYQRHGYTLMRESPSYKIGSLMGIKEFEKFAFLLFLLLLLLLLLLVLLLYIDAEAK